MSGQLRIVLFLTLLPFACVIAIDLRNDTIGVALGAFAAGCASIAIDAWTRRGTPRRP